MASKDAPKPSHGPTGKVSPWVKAFVVFHLLAITVWCLPRPPIEIMNGKKQPVGTDWLLYWNTKFLKEATPIKVYCSATGFWQYWDMFSPNPAQTDVWGDAYVIYRNGERKTYAYPRIYLLPIPQKYPMERYRKFFERVHDDNYKFLWPVFAERVAYLMDTDPANPPAKVVLRRCWRDVAPPGRIQAMAYNSSEFYEYAVDESRLPTRKRTP